MAARVLQFTFSALLVTTAAVLSGCESDEVRVYNVPKQATATNTTRAVTVAGIRMQVPVDWKTNTERKDFRIAGFDIQQGTDRALVTIGQGGGDLLFNINRWRGQVGLPPITALNEADIRKVNIAGKQADVVTMVGEKEATRVAIVSRADKSVITFKIQGAAPVVASQAPAFDAFLQSIQFAQ
jgi:hypothetical protein